MRANWVTRLLCWTSPLGGGSPVGVWTTSWVVPYESLNGKKERDLETLLDGAREVGVSGGQAPWGEKQSGGRRITVLEGASQRGRRESPRPQR